MPWNIAFQQNLQESESDAPTKIPSYVPWRAASNGTKDKIKNTKGHIAQLNATLPSGLSGIPLLSDRRPPVTYVQA